MRVCDKCAEMEKSVMTVDIPVDGINFDLCSKHRDELYAWLATTDGRRRLFKRVGKSKSKQE